MLVARTIRTEDALNLGPEMPKELRDDRHAAAGDAPCNLGIAKNKMLT